MAGPHTDSLTMMHRVWREARGGGAEREEGGGARNYCRVVLPLSRHARLQCLPPPLFPTRKSIGMKPCCYRLQAMVGAGEGGGVAQKSSKLGPHRFVWK
jgi:hypothetical protein